MSLHVENIKKGMKILVRKGPEMPARSNLWAAWGNYPEEGQPSRRDKTMEGVVFKVMGVSPPFIAVKPYAGPGFMNEAEVQTGHLDLREYEVVMADPGYVKALRENVVERPTAAPLPLPEPQERRRVQRLVDGKWVWEYVEE